MREYLVVRNEKTEELRVCPVVAGYKPQPQQGYRWAGPFKSKKAAQRAVQEKRQEVYDALYGNA